MHNKLKIKKGKSNQKAQSYVKNPIKYFYLASPGRPPCLVTPFGCGPSNRTELSVE